MDIPGPIVKDLVLVGGGHSHIAVMRRFAMTPLPGVRVTLISRDVQTPYSGMLPGIVAGHYSPDEAHIDLEVLARFGQARAIFDEAIGLDLTNRQVTFRSRPPISFDVLSINIGSTPTAAVRGSLEHAIPVKPIDRFIGHWEVMRERLQRVAGRHRIAVVGAGAGGVELILALEYRLRSMCERQGRSASHLEYQLFSATETILPTHNRLVRQIFSRTLRERGIVVHAGSAVVEVLPRRLRTADGAIHEADDILWTTEASAAAWLADAGLAVDEAGFVRVSSTLQSVSHPEVFAAGDAASMVESPRPKSGVFAVRQGLPLARNLRRALLGRRLGTYHPQRRFLGLITTGDKYAVASRGSLALHGRWVWRWKDWIDRRFIRQYSDLPAMAVSAAPALPGGLADQATSALLSQSAMRCGGCGAKVGSTVLTRVLQRLPNATRDDVLIGLDAPDDAAVVDGGGGTLLVHSVDFFRAIVDDPYVFGRIAATHALSDIYAVGGEPRTALALVTIPYGPDAKVEDTLIQLMAGASAVLRDAGAALIGGHTSEGGELAMGFAVNGRVARSDILRKSGLRAGDRLLLTKAIGTGTLFAADMRHQAKGRWIAAAIATMTQSSGDAARSLLAHGATACTDVTGFGLIGHLIELLHASTLDAEIRLDAIPLLDGAEETVRAGFLSSLHDQNLRLSRTVAGVGDMSDNPRVAVLFDPQTSGGLLAGVPADRALACLADLRARGYSASAVIGSVLPRGNRPERVTLRL